MSERQPPFLLRLCIVISGFVLLIGTVGAVYQFLSEKDLETATGEGLAPRVRVVGASDGMDILVNTLYRDGDVDHRLRAQSLELEPGVWMLIEAPTDRTVTIEVLDRAVTPHRLLEHRDARLHPGQTVTIDLSDR